MQTDARLSLLELLAERRFPEAERQLRRMLIADPADAASRALRALVLADLERLDEATAEARRAAADDPELAYAQWVLGCVLAARGRFAEAVPVARRAVGLAPADPDHHFLLARCHAGAASWSAARDAAERGLALDPGHTGCANLRALALQGTGRPADADQAFVDALSLDTANAFARAGRGWLALRQGHDPRAALPHFQHALQIDPGSAWARDGMMAALKARNPVYRAMLRYFLWMNSLTPGTRWAIILGGVLGFNLLRRVSRAQPELLPFLLPLMVAYGIFLLLSWTADPLFDFLLRFDPVGRTLVPPDRRAASLWVVATLGVALSCAVGALATGVGAAWMLALFFALLVIPVSATFGCEPGWPRTAMGAYTAAVAVLGVAGAALDGEPGRTLFVVGILGAVLGSWLGRGLASTVPAR